MRQIPSEGEFCKGCPCFDRYYARCNYYLDEGHPHNKRLYDCLRDKPQVLTLEQREDLFRAGRGNELLFPEEADHEPR